MECSLLRNYFLDKSLQWTEIANRCGTVMYSITEFEAKTQYLIIQSEYAIYAMMDRWVNVFYGIRDSFLCTFSVIWWLHHWHFLSKFRKTDCDCLPYKRQEMYIETILIELNRLSHFVAMFMRFICIFFMQIYLFKYLLCHF